MKTYNVIVKMYQFAELRIQAKDEDTAKKLAERYALWHGWNEQTANFEAVAAQEERQPAIINEIS